MLLSILNFIGLCRTLELSCLENASSEFHSTTKMGSVFKVSLSDLFGLTSQPTGLKFHVLTLNESISPIDLRVRWALTILTR